MRKAKKTEGILNVLAKGALATLEILDEILPNYYRSYKAAKRGLYVGTIKAKKDWKERVAKQRFYSLLNQLKQQGFIERKKVDKSAFWKITEIGLKKLKLIQEDKLDYASVSDDKLKIIIYDIPEKEKRRRFWLREALKILGFKRLQKSVWIGKNKIPEKFLYDLRKKGILYCIHILEINKKGTMKELV